MKKVTNALLYDLKNVSQPLAVGPFVFYLETQMNKEENTYETSLWRLDPATKERTVFGNNNKKYAYLKASKDKKQLAFLAWDDETKKMQIYIQPLQGGSASRLTAEKEGVTQYFWLDTGELLYQTKKPEELKEKNDDQPTATHNKHLMHKIDGGTFLEEGRNIQIKKISQAGNNAETLVELSADYSLVNVKTSESLLYFVGPKAEDDDWEYGTRIFSYDSTNGELKTVTTDMAEGMLFDITFSPEEQHTLLVGNDMSYHFVTENEIYLLTADQQLEPLTAELDADLGDSLVGDFQQNLDPATVQWLNDEQFMFSTTEAGTIKLYLGNLKGQLDVLFDEDLHVTDWTLDASQEKVYLTYSNFTVPSRLAVFDLKAKKLVDLYDPNAETLKEIKMSVPEELSYKGARDWKIQGWYVPPVTETASHPAILYVHGGPQVSYGKTFFHEMQALAAAGYGVIMLNPRGGSGYGQSFVAAILGDYGNEDYIDLMLGVDHVLAKHQEIDPSQLFVCGGSYGGFMTNWIVTHTNRFRAAVTQRSICNWISFFGTSDVGPHFVIHQLLHDLSDVEALWKMSPLAYAENMDTPLLVLHGQDDHRCPLEQGEQIYRAALKQGLDTELMTFPQSSHGLSREGLPNLRQERLEAVVHWFDQYKN